MSLSIDDLRSFILVVRERSVSRAAVQLGVTQQSVSERIRRLERRLGVQLFARLPHGMQPKPAAYRLLPYAHTAVTSVEQAMRIVDDDDLLRIVVQPSIAPALSVLKKGLAGVRFEVESEADVQQVMTALGDGVVDLGLGSFTSADVPAVERGIDERGIDERGIDGGSSIEQPPVEEAPIAEGEGEGTPIRGRRGVISVTTPPAEVVVEQLFADRVIWVAPPDHPLANRGEALSGAELAELAVGVSFSNGRSGGALGPDANGDHSEPPAEVRIAARSTVAGALEDGRLVEVAVDLPGWVLPISMAYRSTDRDRPAIAALRVAIVEEHNRSQGAEVAG